MRYTNIKVKRTKWELEERILEASKITRGDESLTSFRAMSDSILACPNKSKRIFAKDSRRCAENNESGSDRADEYSKSDCIRE
jgi:hypothetical protein